jgi:membrane protease YdiL (CAAX protease family)
MATDRFALDEQLIDAAARAEVALVKSLLDRGAHINGKSKEGNTALMAAAYHGHLPVVKVLLDRGADANSENELGDTALMAAAYQGHLPVVKFLLDRGADVNSKDKNGLTPLMAASLRGDIEVVSLLLEKGADVNAKNRWGNSALTIASNKGDAQITDLIKAHRDMSPKWVMILGAARLVAVLVILMIVAKMGHLRSLEHPFFEDQKWTLNDAYKIVIPLLALTYLQFSFHSALTEYGNCITAIFGSAYCISIYACYYFFIKRRYAISTITLGLDKKKFFKTGILNLNIAVILLLLLIVLEPKLTGPLPDIPYRHITPRVFLYLITVLLSVFVGPVLEELLFRGILFAPVARRTGAWKAVALLSLIGGLWHWQHTDILMLRDIAVFALLYYLYIKSQSLYTPIIWHLTLNFAASRSETVTVLESYIDSNTLDGYYIYTLLSLLFLANFLWLIGFPRKVENHQSDKGSCNAREA